MSDAQIEANVLKALAGAPELADQAITSTTVYGTVTLKGMVRDEASRDMAEKLVSNASGVQKVVDELTIGTDAAVGSNNQPAQGSAEEGTNPQLQSDGTMAPAAGPQDQNSAGSAAPQLGNQQGNQQGNVPQAAPAYPPMGPRRPVSILPILLPILLIADLMREPMGSGLMLNKGVGMQWLCRADLRFESASIRRWIVGIRRRERCLMGWF